MEQNFKDGDPTLSEIEDMVGTVPDTEVAPPGGLDINKLFKRGAKVRTGMPYRPKLKLRVECDRIKQVFAFDVDIPVEGKDQEILKELNVKLKDVLRRLQLI